MKAAAKSLVPAPTFLHFTVAVRAICRFMHAHISTNTPPDVRAHISTNTPPDVRTANYLIIMHAKRGHLHLAHQWFAQMPHKNIFSWTILISAYSQHRKLDRCFGLFSQMLSHHRPNDFAYSSLLSVCDYWHGVQVHGLALRTSFDAWIYVANALMAMYWNNSCNAGVEAWRVFEAMDFRNLVTYNSMITGLSMHKQGDKAMDLFIGMHHNGIEFDHTTLLTLVSSLCGSNEGSNNVAGLICCLQLHSFGIKTGLALDIGVVTALIRSYSILGGEVDACHKLFLETSGMERDIVLWTEIMMASAEREPEQTLVLFKRMLGEDLFPDCYIFSVVLKACSNLVAERNASALHCQVIKAGFLNVLELGNALIHAYARSGSIDNAEQVFFEMSLRDIVSWNSVLKAYAVHGKAEAALDFFKQMDVAPDGTTFVALLSSCSHAGMVKEGTKIFDTMYEKYGITPQLDHYACMVDILGRAGHLSEAENIIKKMPMQPDHVIWSALLAACRKHGEKKLANLASSKLKELDPENSLGYVLISNIYCSANSFDEADSVRMKMNREGVRKEPGLSWIEIRHRMHEFASGGTQHPQIKAIRANMEKLLRQLKKMGYVPETSSVLFDVEEEHKEEQVYHHSEKLALVFYLMNAADSNSRGNVIKIIKNIRICSDCHNFMRLASKLIEKVIIVRDANRFHHFKDGACSCNDYW
ncbi:pentatricopeptide repeat-containing protein At1g71420 [Sesamum indicum]|uniref:Pentatricopeptide repeat-containing protein At1g71420 n=1 Tax=Sesamum indicum TaxID=4182 RepID=A0A6I9T2K9_SESIN|nr:pentatricopeptide repeat-containing protein At1g71420 [Sesamum indicum]